MTSKAACHLCRQALALRCKIGEILTCATQDDGAGLAHLHPGEVDELVLADHDLLYQLAAPQLHRLRLVKGRRDLAACKQAISLSDMGASGLHPAAAFLLDYLACGRESHNVKLAAVQALRGDPVNIYNGQAV